MRAWPELLTIIIPLIILGWAAAACCRGLLVWGECGARAAPLELVVLWMGSRLPLWCAARRCDARVDGVRASSRHRRLLESYMPLASHRGRKVLFRHNDRYLCT